VWQPHPASPVGVAGFARACAGSTHPSGVRLGRNGTSLTLRNTHVKNTRFAVEITSYDSLVEGNLIANFSGDGIRVTRDGTTVAHNVIKYVYVSSSDGDDNHDDAIQCFLFNVGTGTVRGVAATSSSTRGGQPAAQRLAPGEIPT
jgi:hypothetical protein